MSLTIEERQLIELRIRNDAPSAVVAYVMWGFLGLISAHRFYLGRPRSAVLQILSELTVVGWFIWWLYDAVMISAYIRDDKAALRAKLIEELESEKHGGAPAPRPRIVETPSAAPAPAPAPAKAAPPMAAAASMPVNPEKPAADADLVLVSRPGQPLVLDDPRPETAVIAPAPAPTPKVAIDLGDRAEAQAAATLAFSAPPPEPAAAGVPHPEAVDDSPIEVFPPKPAPIEPVLHEPVQSAPAPTPPTEAPAPKADEWVMGEPLRLDRNPLG